jgi:hypothetical protein
MNNGGIYFNQKTQDKIDERGLKLLFFASNINGFGEK